MDSERTDCEMDDHWLIKMRDQWKSAGRIAPPDDVGVLLDQTARGWQEDERDRELVAAVKQGDREAFDALVEIHAKRAYHRALRIVGDPDSAEDIVQQSFLDCWRTRDHLKPARGFRRLILMIVKQRSIDMLGWRSRHPAVSLEEALEYNEGIGLPVVEDTNDPMVLAERNEEARIVREEVNRLAEEHRLVINLCDFGDLSYAEAGEVLHISKSAVKARHDKALATLRKQLEERLGEGAFIAGGKVE
jgi:RNA polymerase sigma-70 factor, ECF subfamily